MIQFKSRLADLIEQIERGADPTPEELRRMAQLQALDIAKAGEDYLREHMQLEAEQTEAFRKLLEE